MDLVEAQELMRSIYYQRDSARGVDRTLLRTFEELGELSDAVLKHRSRAAVADEMADVLAWLCSLANLLDVDLSTALTKKYNGVCSRCRKAPCECTETP
jgi:NTP pyrophosphatase (non-canonical NTP hydrolase)